MRLGLASTFGIAALVALNTLSGTAKIQGFRHERAAEQALAQSRLDDAYSGFQSALNWQPGDARACAQLGRVVQLALSNSIPLEVLPDGSPQAMLGLGLERAALGIAINPGDSRGWFGLAGLYQSYRARRVRTERMLRAGASAGQEPAASDAVIPGMRPEDRLAVAATLKAVELQPEMFHYHDYLAGLYWRDGFVQLAGDALRESLALRPRLEAHEVLGDRDLSHALAEEILEGLERGATNRFAGPLMAARARAEMLERLDRLEEALAAYEELRRAGGERLEGPYNLALGKLDQRRGLYRESIPRLLRAVELGGDGGSASWALYHLGVAHSKLEEHGVASDFYRRFIEREPDRPHGYLGLGWELETLRQVEEAEALYREALERFPDNEGLYRRLIRVLKSTGRVQEAEAYSQLLPRIPPP